MNNLQQRDSRVSGLHSIRTQSEVAEIMTERGYPMNRSMVYALEKRALRKMAKHPILAALARDLGIVAEDELQ